MRREPFIPLGTSVAERAALRSTDGTYAVVRADNRPADATPQLSVITTAYNAATTILETLDGFADQSAQPSTYELVIVDDCSTDQTLAAALSFAAAHPELAVRVVALSQNVGAARARSVGVDHAMAPLIGFFDADDAPNHEYIEAHLEAHASTGDNQAITCAAMSTARFDSPASAVAERLQATSVGSIFGSIPWAGGGTVVMHRAIYNRLEGNDPTMIGAEDLDFSVRAWLHRVPLVFVPGALCHYRQRTSISAAWRQRRAYGRGHVALVRKYWPIVNRWRYTYWQLRGFARLPRQLSKAAYQACRSDRGRFAPSTAPASSVATSAGDRTDCLVRPTARCSRDQTTGSTRRLQPSRLSDPPRSGALTLEHHHNGAQQ
ncbi:MAG: glycosyltransferase family 2 protein [Acidimicrobiales bacterium]